MEHIRCVHSSQALARRISFAAHRGGDEGEDEEEVAIDEEKDGMQALSRRQHFSSSGSDSDDKCAEHVESADEYVESSPTHVTCHSPVMELEGEGDRGNSTSTHVDNPSRDRCVVVCVAALSTWAPLIKAQSSIKHPPPYACIYIRMTCD